MTLFTKMWWLVESMWWWVGLFACIQVSLLAVGICLDLLLLGELPVDPDAMAVVYEAEKQMSNNRKEETR